LKRYAPIEQANADLISFVPNGSPRKRYQGVGISIRIEQCLLRSLINCRRQNAWNSEWKWRRR
jgi:hypothetical protein